MLNIFTPRCITLLVIGVALAQSKDGARMANTLLAAASTF